MASARDNYPEYFAERLWDWTPETYRDLDATDGGDSLRALLHAIGSQAAVARRSQDRLWDDMFVELADDWAVPYIAALVATRLVSALNPRARRADVAKTIYYRRRKGTLAVLEQLIADMTGWDGKVVEEFRRLARMRHGLDGAARAGTVTGTPEGGLADLRSVRGARLAGDPFDELHYTPETRRPFGRLGLRGIQVLGFHLYRLQSVEFDGVAPRRVDDLPGARDGYTMDPSGRDVPLFASNDPARDWAAWTTAAEWALPRAIDCRLLNEAVFVVGDDAIAWILGPAPVATLALRQAAAADLRRLANERFPSREALVRVLSGLPQSVTLTSPGVLVGVLQESLVDACGSAALLPDASGQAAFGPPALQIGFDGAPPVPRDRTRAANLATWPTPVIADVDLLVDPARGRFLFDASAQGPQALRVRYRVGQPFPIGAGAFLRELDDRAATVVWSGGSTALGIPATGIVEIDDSATYAPLPDQAAIADLTVRAAPGQRPFLRLAADWQLGAAGANRTLTLDGLWIGALAAANVVIAGDWSVVTLRSCTLDPGGLDAMGAALPPVTLVIEGTIDRLVIDHAILPAVVLQGAGAGVDELVMVDAIVDATQPGAAGIVLPRTHTTMVRTTLIASAIAALCVHVERIDATDSLIAGVADVTDLQHGCFRFSARGAGSRVPHPYESHELDELQRLFASRRFGDPEYATLSPRAPAPLLEGSEQQSEIGATCANLDPIKLASLLAKLAENMPFGRLPAILLEN